MKDNISGFLLTVVIRFEYSTSLPAEKEAHIIRFGFRPSTATDHSGCSQSHAAGQLLRIVAMIESGSVL